MERDEELFSCVVCISVFGGTLQDTRLFCIKCFWFIPKKLATQPLRLVSAGAPTDDDGRVIHLGRFAFSRVAYNCICK